jgi:MSHA biogenesis protein MshI
MIAKMLNLGWLNRSGYTAGLACGTRQLALIGLDVRTASSPRLQTVSQADVESPEERQRLLHEWVAHSGLRGRSVVLTLLPSEYQLLHIERPPVKEDELLASLRWRIKDLLDYPAEEAVLDVFQIPDSSHRGRPKMISVAAARFSVLQQWAQLAASAGLKPKTIDITELALRNLSERATAAAIETVATLCLLPNSGMIQIGRGAQLYLARELDYGLTMFTGSSRSIPGDEPHERLALELQRTMDYYDSQFGLAPPRRLLMLPVDNTVESLAQAVSTSLGLATQLLPLDQVVEWATDSPTQLSAIAALALGGALPMPPAEPEP